MIRQFPEMTRDQVYEIWTHETSPWSRWVKPVLFSFIGERELQAEKSSIKRWRIPLSTDVAIIADLPGEDGVLVGLALCFEGYRPIPVYNACPFATYDPYCDEIVSIMRTHVVSAPAVVDLIPIMSALCGAAGELAAANLPSLAPPIFLLDANRHGCTLRPNPGWFDNRSFVATADFPSTQFFKEHGISLIVLVQNKPKIQPDLLHVLLALQRDGMKIARQTLWEPWEPQAVKVKRPPVFAYAWQKFLFVVGYHRDPLGCFGELVRPSSS